jgi:putative ABC transport system permease protein
MNPFARGVRNAFRNATRTISIVIILGLSIGLSLTMLVANKAVSNKIESVKSSIGNTITISPAGFNPGSQTNNALTTAELDKLKSISHVASVTETLTDRQSTTGSSTPSFGRMGEDSSSSTTTSLTSPVTLSGNRFMGGGASDSSGTTTTTSFSLPVSFLGTTTPTSLDGSTLTIKSGAAISASSDTNNALISQAMADKNNLKVGDTFTAYNATLTVAGIFTTSSSNQGANNTVILSLTALQRLSGQSSVTSAVVTVDSLDNLTATTTAVKNSLGSNADVTSSEEEADNTVKPLNSVKTVSTFSLIGAVVAGAVIILLTMIMIVRERKREIGVVKAIGGSNLRIIGEFMVESLTLAVLGAIIGLIIGVIGGQPVTKALVSNSTSSTTTTSTTQMGPGGMGAPGGGSSSSSSETRPTGGFGGGFGNRVRSNQAVRGLSNIKAQIGWSILIYGFGAAILIAIIGSGLAAGLIAKVRPSNVMRAD